MNEAKFHMIGLQTKEGYPGPNRERPELGDALCHLTLPTDPSQASFFIVS